MSSGQFQQNTVDRKGSPLSSNSASPMSASKEPFNTSSLSANSTMSMPNTVATESFVTQQRQTHTKPNNPHLQDAQLGLFGNTITPLRASLKPEEAPNPANNIASIALSSQASAGAGSVKVSKRRPRPNNKTPIAVLSADTSNFRAMVQQLTGIPTSPSIQHYGSQICGSSGLPLLKPHPTRPYDGTLNLPLQDFSYLQSSHQPLSGPLLGANFAAELGYMQGRDMNNMLQGNPPHDFKSFLPNHQANPINYGTPPSLPSLLDHLNSGRLRGNYPTFKEDLKQASSHGMMRESDQFTVKQAPAPSGILPMKEDLHAKSSYNAVDSWLAFDGALANHAPKVELA